MEITSFSKTIELKACIYFNQHYRNFHQGYLKPASCHLSAFWFWNTIFRGGMSQEFVEGMPGFTHVLNQFFCS